MAPCNLLKAQAVKVRAAKGMYESNNIHTIHDLAQLRMEHSDMQEGCWREQQQLYAYKAINEELRCENEDLLTANASLLTEHEDLERRIKDQQQILSALKKEAKHLAKANKAKEEMLRKNDMKNNYLEAQNSIAQDRNVEHFNIFRSIQREIVNDTQDLEKVKSLAQRLEHNHKVLKAAINELQAQYEEIATNGIVASSKGCTSKITLPVSTSAASIASTADMEAEIQSMVGGPIDSMTDVVDSKLGKQQGWAGFNMFAVIAKRACEHLMVKDCSKGATIIGGRRSSGCTDDTRRASLFGWVGRGGVTEVQKQRCLMHSKFCGLYT